MKEAAYKRLVRPILVYGSSVWDPHSNGLNGELEIVQKRASRFVTRNYSRETGSMTSILEELKNRSYLESAIFKSSKISTFILMTFEVHNKSEKS